MRKTRSTRDCTCATTEFVVTDSSRTNPSKTVMLCDAMCEKKHLRRLRKELDEVVHSHPHPVAGVRRHPCVPLRADELVHQRKGVGRLVQNDRAACQCRMPWDCQRSGLIDCAPFVASCLHSRRGLQSACAAASCIASLASAHGAAHTSGRASTGRAAAFRAAASAARASTGCMLARAALAQVPRASLRRLSCGARGRGRTCSVRAAPSSTHHESGPCRQTLRTTTKVLVVTGERAATRALVRRGAGAAHVPVTCGDQLHAPRARFVGVGPAGHHEGARGGRQKAATK